MALITNTSAAPIAAGDNAVRRMAAGANQTAVAEVRKAVQASDLLLGHDEYAMAWISAFRADQKKAAVAS